MGSSTTAQSQLRFLAQTSAILGRSLDYEPTLETVLRAVAPEFADWAAIDLVEPQGRLRRLGPPQPGPDLADPADAWQAIRSGKPELRETPTTSRLVAPLISRGQTFGALTLVLTQPGRRYEEADAELAEALASRAARAVDAARLHQETVYSRERMELALEAGGLGAWEVDVQSLTIVWSLQLEQIHGIAPGTFDGTLAMFARVIHPDDREHVLNHLRDAIATQAPRLALTYRAVRDDGSQRWIEASARLLFGPGGRPERLVGVSADVTARRQAEQNAIELAAEQAARAHAEEGRRNVERVAQELARSNADLAQFAYVASHDLQEPLRMISSYVQLLQRRYQGKLDADADLFIGFATEGARRMKQLIDDLLTYSRVGSDNRSPTTIDPTRALARSLANLKAVLADAGGLVTNGTLPPVRADEAQLSQVFQNLIGNALKFRAAAQPRVHVSARPEGPMVQFSVQDNGIGIAEQHFEKIFVIFQRLHTHDEYDGTGIGLPLCKKIIERHGGRIWLTSTPGAGSTFYFTLPAAC